MTQTNVLANKKSAYISRVDVDSFISGRIEQQQRNEEPHIKYLSLKVKFFNVNYSI